MATLFRVSYALELAWLKVRRGRGEHGIDPFASKRRWEMRLGRRLTGCELPRKLKVPVDSLATFTIANHPSAPQTTHQGPP